MLLMETYLCYCSVRLGVIIAALIASLTCFTLSTLLLIYGAEVMDPVMQVVANDEQYHSSLVLKMLLSWKDTYPDDIMILVHLRYYVHISVAMVAIYAALKLKKWLLLPFLIFEILNCLELFSFHVSIMVALKKVIGLGVLVAITLVGCFYLLFLMYNIAACVALFQIINLVNSQHYRAIYGDDPFNPIVSNAAGAMAVQSVRVLETPKSADMAEEKRLAKLGAMPRTENISFIDVKANYCSQPLTYAKARKWWQSEEDFDRTQYKANDMLIYHYWQYTELIGGKRRQQKN